jgi:SAM-dependent methyltransferase
MGLSMSAEADSDPYVDIPYPALPIRCSHPEVLAVVGTLAGLHPAPVDRCRVLEIGCGDGGNLLPMALGLPGSEFVGIDPSGPAVDRGRDLAKSLALRNVVLEKKGVEELGDGLGSFDYIICHGVFSWVVPELQEKILEASRRFLQPEGLAFVSYNTFPGWHVRGMIREMLLYHVRKEPSPAAQVTLARQFLSRLSDAVGEAGNVARSATDLASFASSLRHERAFLDDFPDYYISHEHLERENLPLYFHQFAGRAARHGLQYVSEAVYFSGQPAAYPAAVAGLAEALAQDPIEIQQYLDFATNRAFRESVLCRADRRLAPSPDPGLLRGLHVSSSAISASTSGDKETFAVPQGPVMTTSDPALRAAFVALVERWPASISFDGLQALVRERTGVDAPKLAEALLDAFVRGMVELHPVPPRFTTSTAGRLKASPLARLQTAAGYKVTTLRHEQVTLDDLCRSWLPFFDGTRDEAGVLELLLGLVKDGKMAVNTPEGAPITDPAERAKQLSEALRYYLRRIADSALLEASKV